MYVAKSEGKNKFYLAGDCFSATVYCLIAVCGVSRKYGYKLWLMLLLFRFFFQFRSDVKDGAWIVPRLRVTAHIKYATGPYVKILMWLWVENDQISTDV